MKVVLDAEPWKLAPDLIPKFWTPLELPRPARIAVIWDDGVVKPHPPITRALREVVEACRKAGMDVIDWTPWQHDRAWEIISALYFPDGGSSYIKPICDGEEPVLPLTDWITRGQPSCKVMSMYEEWEMVAARDEYRRQYARLWNATANNAADEVDAILCPVGPGAAPAHETSRYWGYTAHWNLLDYPAVSFPVTKVDAAKDLPDANYTPRNKTDAYVHSLYTGPDAFEDAPVNLQLVCRRHFDEKVLAVLGQVEKAMGRG
ncbi:hypothetical protein KEM55_000926 [Ascosphaera atra]|nr:hypothetical protein KEM55_000926 [Ascosphaera atra]